MHCPLYYCNITNFGDQFNIPFFRHFGFDPQWAQADKALVAGCGSIFGHVAGNPHVVTFGSGMHAPFKHACLHGQIPLVRGPYTRGLIYGPLTSGYGDPGLMASALWPNSSSGARPRDARIIVGLIPHINDRNSVHFSRLAGERDFDARMIDPRGEPEDVAEAVSLCDFIVSSSLHGIIFAHSYGIPAVWVRDSISEPGCGFKFYDYFASVGISSTGPAVLVPSSDLHALSSLQMGISLPVLSKIQKRIQDAAIRLPDLIQKVQRRVSFFCLTQRKIVRKLDDFGIRIAGRSPTSLPAEVRDLL